jgi:hypothetical protein
MNTNFLILLVLSLFSHTLFSQNDDAFTTFKMESIYLKGGKYIKNDVQYPIGFLGKNLGDEMNISPHAIAEWNKHKSFRNWSLLTSAAGLALTIVAFNSEGNNNRFNLALAGLGLTIVSLPLSIKSQNQLHKAVWTRNRDLFQM